VVIDDASCNLNPADPTTSAFSFQWEVTSAPSGATPILNNATTLTPEFSSETAGSYTLTLTCSSFIGCNPVQESDTLNIEIPEIPPPVPPDTQGGTLCSLNKSSNNLYPSMGDWMMFMTLPFFLLLRRWGKKIFLSLFLIFFIVPQAHALSTSFSVNTFQPTVDDSEYFTVYSAPTMLKRNFHVGFYLDYAHHPYEFGDQNFNRVAGIVDSLLTGNILGSYGITDWFNAGLLIPVYFWEGIRSSTFGNENNFDLGDVQLVLKFRLVDRERHHVGVSIVPFIVFPSSTGNADFLGNGSFSGGGKLVIDGRIKDRVSLALNVGYLSRDKITDVGGNVIDDQFLASLGLSVDLIKEKFKLIGEAETATVVDNFFSQRRTTPTEARVGFRYTWMNNHDINVGSGFGLTNGIGSPDYRIFAGYTYTKRPVAEVAVSQPPVSEIEVGDEITVGDKIYFEFDKAVVRDISQPTLDKVAAFLKAHPEVTKIRISGYTCDLGTDSYNLKLSQRRAKAVEDYLIGQEIDPSRMGSVQGFGEADPLVPNIDEMHREQNRRVQIFVEEVQN
jgi:outer membrane protein OmpA-like peptidoglycan-associated protein